MPKAECKKCFKSMPLQILALHVKECNTAEYEKLSDSEPELSNLPPDSPDLSPATEEKSCWGNICHRGDFRPVEIQ
ncbi:uncharacterized protein isoform X4 [Danio rerio]|uniref:Uncharacterized protein isoform X4 n=1 Tax=Danio rerio TaxID=7955 RepID=A0AC58JIY6_DANRE